MDLRKEGTALTLAKEKDRLVLYPRREEYGEALLDRVGHALKERCITPRELLEDGEEIREAVTAGLRAREVDAVTSQSSGVICTGRQ